MRLKRTHEFERNCMSAYRMSRLQRNFMSGGVPGFMYTHSSVEIRFRIDRACVSVWECKRVCVWYEMPIAAQIEICCYKTMLRINNLGSPCNSNYLHTEYHEYIIIICKLHSYYDGRAFSLVLRARERRPSSNNVTCVFFFFLFTEKKKLKIYLLHWWADARLLYYYYFNNIITVRTYVTYYHYVITFGCAFGGYTEIAAAVRARTRFCVHRNLARNSAISVRSICDQNNNVRVSTIHLCNNAVVAASAFSYRILCHNV